MCHSTISFPLRCRILQSQCVFVPIAPHNTSTGRGCLDSVIKLGVVNVLVHLDELDSFLSLPDVQHTWIEDKGCAIDLEWMEYGFALVSLPHARKNELSVLSEDKSLSAGQSCVKGDPTSTNRCSSVPHCKDLEDVPTIKPVIYPRSHPLRSASIAYVMHTSGTTGARTPVHVPHCCITPNILDLRMRFGIHRDDVVFNAAPMTFDPAIVEVCGTLGNGNAEHVVIGGTNRLVGMS